MQTAAKPPVWKYQRQFDYGDGVSTAERRPNLLTDIAPQLLNDEQVRTFLANGVLTLQPELPQAFHRALFDKFVTLIGEDNDDNPGNNLLPIVPELQLVYDDAVIKGALTSVLGDGYMMHPHRVLHDNPPGSAERLAGARPPRSGRGPGRRRSGRIPARRQSLHHGLRRRGARAHRYPCGQPRPDPVPEDRPLVPADDQREPVLTNPIVILGLVQPCAEDPWSLTPEPYWRLRRHQPSLPFRHQRTMRAILGTRL